MPRMKLDSERWRINDSTLNTRKSACHEFHGHKCFAWEWRFQQCRFFGRKAEAGIVARVSKHDDDPLTACSQQVQPLLDEPLADSSALIFWDHRDRGQRHCGDESGRGINPHSAKQNMTDDGRLPDGHERDERVPGASKFVHQVGFGRFSEGGLIDGPNGLEFSELRAVFSTNFDACGCGV